MASCASQRDYELIVLDTPPTAHALDFLDAPNRDARLPGQRGGPLAAHPGAARPARLSLQPGAAGLQGYVAKTIARITGGETLQELAAFLGRSAG